MVAGDIDEEIPGHEPVKLQLSLLENAYDSLNDSLDSLALAEGQVRKWKLAIFLLVHAIELVLKERLRREHALLVFSNVDKPGHTVSMEIALVRLQAVGVAIDASDTRAIRTAIGWRDRIVHYEIELSVQEAQQVFALLFEFLHSFHRRELGSELHAQIAPANWQKEAELMEVFRSEFVVYNEVDVIKSWPAEIVAAQGLTDVTIEGQAFHRIAFGFETRWSEDWDPADHPCHDCAVVRGQLHVPGCDMETCPRCGGQFITCACDVEGVPGAEGENDNDPSPHAPSSVPPSTPEVISPVGPSDTDSR